MEAGLQTGGKEKKRRGTRRNRGSQPRRHTHAPPFPGDRLVAFNSIPLSPLFSPIPAGGLLGPPPSSPKASPLPLSSSSSQPPSPPRLDCPFRWKLLGPGVCALPSEPESEPPRKACAGGPKGGVATEEDSRARSKSWTEEMEGVRAMERCDGKLNEEKVSWRVVKGEWDGKRGEKDEREGCSARVARSPCQTSLRLLSSSGSGG